MEYILIFIAAVFVSIDLRHDSCHLGDIHHPEKRA